MAQPGSYLPRLPPEQELFYGLWRAATNDSGGILTGKDGVTFLRSSGVDAGILKQIWGLSSSDPTMTITQFYTALRYVVLVQNGEFPVTREKLIETLGNTSYMPPRFTGVNLPAPIPSSPMYVLTPEDHYKYHQLFITYDTNSDGYLSGPEAAGVFNRSGLPADTLRHVWNFADDDKDNRLTSKEFSLGFHLIVCIGKKQLPLPPALPAPLRMFLAVAPAVPNTPTGDAAKFDASAAAKPAAPAPPPAPAPAPAAAPAKPDYDAFNALDPGLPPAPAPAPVPVPVPMPVPAAIPAVESKAPSASMDLLGGGSSMGGMPSPMPSPMPPSYNATASSAPMPSMGGAADSDLSGAMMGMKETTTQALMVQDRTIEQTERGASSIKGLIQRMKQDKVAMSAAVESAQNNARETALKLESTIVELQQLAGELAGLREELDNARKAQLTGQSQLTQKSLERQTLMQEIADTRAQISQASQVTILTAAEMSSTDAQAAQLAGRIEEMDHEKSALQADISASNGEIETLREILKSLRGDMSSTIRGRDRMKAEAETSRQHLRGQEELAVQKEREIEYLNDQKKSLDGERRGLLNEMANGNGVAATNGKSRDSFDAFNVMAVPSPAPSPSPALKPSPAPALAAAVDEPDPFDTFGAVDTTPKASRLSNASSEGFDAGETNGFDAPADVPNDGFQAFDDAGFGGDAAKTDISPANTHTTEKSFGFDDVYSSTSPRAKSTEEPVNPFGAMGSEEPTIAANAAPSGDGFPEDEFFSSFGAKADGDDGFGAPAGDDGFGAPAVGGDDGFGGGFGEDFGAPSGGDDPFAAPAVSGGGGDGFGDGFGDSFGSSDGFGGTSSTPAPAPAPVPAPVVATSAAPAGPEGAKDDFDAFDAFPDSSTVENAPGPAPAPAPAPAPESVAQSSNDGFDSAAAPSDAASDPFAAMGAAGGSDPFSFDGGAPGAASGGFDSFGDAPKPSGFDSFGDAPKANFDGW